MPTLFSNVPILVEKKKKKKEKGSVSCISTSQSTTGVKRWKASSLKTEVSFSESKEYGAALREAVAIAKRAKGKKVCLSFKLDHLVAATEEPVKHGMYLGDSECIDGL